MTLRCFFLTHAYMLWQNSMIVSLHVSNPYMIHLSLYKGVNALHNRTLKK